jgi:AraC-like DNA-binding protein
MALGSAPQIALPERIDAFWEHSGAERRHRILPDGCMDFIFDLGAGTARLVGAMTTAEVVEVAAGTHLFGVRFLPGAVAPYLTDAASAFVDDSVPLDGVTARATRELAERVAAARGRREREALVVAHLLESRSRLRAGDPRLRRAVTLIARHHGAIAMSEVARAVSLGERQLERLFRAHVGLAPKHFARIARMEHALRLLRDGARPQAEVAALAGYADESHLLRDFRDLAGATPAALRAERSVTQSPAVARDVGFVQSAPASLP